MTNPKRAVRNSGFGGRGYRKLGEGGKPVGITLPSVTTVLKAEDKPALVQWAVDQTVAYAIANADELNRMSESRAYGFLRWYHTRKVDALAAEFDITNYHQGVLSDAGELGTMVHEWVQADVTGVPYPDTTNAGPKFWECVAAWDAFAAANDVSPHFTEHTVWDEKVGYAGTYDAIWTINGRHTFLDIKTGRGLYSSTWMQMAALMKAEEMLVDGDDGADISVRNWNAPVQDIAVMHIRPFDYTAQGEVMEAFCKMVPMPGSLDLHFEAFKGLLQYGQAQLALKNEE